MEMIPCPYCGTRTGLHGFAFNKEGKYDSSPTNTRVAKNPTESIKLSGSPLDWWEMETIGLNFYRH